MARCPRNRMGNRSRCRLAPSRRRTPGCQTARWRLKCKTAVAYKPVGRILLWLRMPKWKSWVEIGRKSHEDRDTQLRGDGVSAYRCVDLIPHTAPFSRSSYDCCICPCPADYESCDITPPPPSCLGPHAIMQCTCIADYADCNAVNYYEDVTRI